MAKLTLTDLADLQNENTAVNAINTNNAAIEAAMEKTLSRDGTVPNTMGANLDMNNNQILNLPAPASGASPARLQDVVSGATMITVPPVGTSGAVVGLLNTNNTHSGNNTFSGTNTFSNANTFSGVATMTSPVLTTPKLNNATPTAAGVLGFGASVNFGDGSANHALLTQDTAQTVTNKTIAGASNTLTVRLANDVTGNLPVTNLNSGTGANAGTYWCGDGSWKVPSHSVFTNSLGADVLLNNASNYFDGPTVAQGSVGTWYVSGTISVTAASGNSFAVKLWDGTNVLASTFFNTPASATTNATVSISGVITNPAGNLRISAKSSGTSDNMKFNNSGNSKDCTITAFRIA